MIWAERTTLSWNICWIVWWRTISNKNRCFETFTFWSNEFDSMEIIKFALAIVTWDFSRNRYTQLTMAWAAWQKAYRIKDKSSRTAHITQLKNGIGTNQTGAARPKYKVVKDIARSFARSLALLQSDKGIEKLSIDEKLNLRNKEEIEVFIWFV